LRCASSDACCFHHQSNTGLTAPPLSARNPTLPTSPQDALEHYERDAAAYARQNGVNGLRYLVLDLTPVSHIDSMGAHMIEELHKDLQERGVQLLLSNPHPQVC
jgi:hypothetical protein